MRKTKVKMNPLLSSKILRLAGTLLFLFFLIVSNSACSRKVDNPTPTIRVGYFPNITHAQAVIGLANGTFTAHLGPEVRIKVTLFNAGPSLIEALFAREIDIGYVGPSPAINGYIQSKGRALKVISGVASGGALFVVRHESNIKQATDLSMKKIATPQLGNTQDISFREYIRKNGLKPTESGGTVSIVHLRNPEILNLLMRKEIDGAWVPEPWGSRLIREAGAELFLDERTLWKDGKFATTLVIVETNFLKKHPGLVKKWLTAHVEITHWINEHLEDAKVAIGNQIKALSGVALPKEIADDAFSRLEITYDPIVSSLFSYAEMAYNNGFFREQKPDLSGMVDLNLLNEVLKEKSLTLVSK